jgi:hypothetical protein
LKMVLADEQTDAAARPSEDHNVQLAWNSETAGVGRVAV